MNLLKEIQIKKIYNKQIRKLPDKELEKLVKQAFTLFPASIDISDGEIRKKHGFFSKNLSDAWEQAERRNSPRSQELDFMLWAVYGTLHEKSIQNFKKGTLTVCLSELNLIEICKRYIKTTITDKTV